MNDWKQLAVIGVTLAGLASFAQAGYVDGRNLYQYVKGNPVAGLDPTAQKTIVLLDGKRAQERARDESGKEGPTLAACMKQWGAEFNRELDAVSSQADKANKIVLNGSVVCRDELKRRLAAARVEIVELDVKVDEAIKQVKQAFAGTSPDTDEIYWIAHGDAGVGLPGSPMYHESNLTIGEEDVSIPKLADLIGELGGKARLSMGSCYWREAQVNKLGGKMKNSVGGSWGLVNPERLSITRSFDVQSQTLTVSLESYWQMMEFKYEWTPPVATATAPTTSTTPATGMALPSTAPTASTPAHP